MYSPIVSSAIYRFYLNINLVPYNNPNKFKTKITNKHSQNKFSFNFVFIYLLDNLHKIHNYLYINCGIMMPYNF